MRKKYWQSRKQICCVFQNERYRVLKNFARQVGLTPTAFLRESAFAIIEQRRIVPRDVADRLPSLIALIRNFTGNLNQIAKHVNALKKATIFDLLKARKNVLDLEKAITDFINIPPESDCKIHVPQNGKLRATLGLHQSKSGRKNSGDSSQSKKPGW